MIRAALVAAGWVAATVAAPVTPARGHDPVAAVSQQQDSVQQRYLQTVRELRDSVAALRARLSNLRRFTGAGDETVLEWAARLHRTCDNATATFGRAEPMFREAGNSQHGRAAGAFVKTIERTRDELNEHCVRGLAPAGAGDRADSLRVWAPYRAGRIELALIAYEREAGRFARAVGIKLDS